MKCNAWHQLVRMCLMVATLWILASCTSISSRSTDASVQPAIGAYWSGRLAVSSDDPAFRSSSASFELSGAPQAGTIRLFTPLGTSLAVAQWDHAGATVAAAGQLSHYANLGALVEALVGVPVPPEALFSWLRGQPQDIPGWSVQATGNPPQRIAARQHAAPAARLVVLLDTE